MPTYRIIVSVAVGYAALWCAGHWYPFPSSNAFLLIVQAKEAGRLANALYLGIVAVYWSMWFCLPFLSAYLLGGLAKPKTALLSELIDEPPVGRRELYVTIGEIHHRIDSGPNGRPTLARIPERGLLCNTIAVGSIGSGKSSGVMGPALDQLLAHKSEIGGLILDPNGDLQRFAKSKLAALGRPYRDIGPDGACYNPLASGFDPHSLSTNIAELVANLHGESKEPYWRQSYTAALSALIRLNLLTSNYVTFVDLYECLLDERQVREKVAQVKRELSSQHLLVMPKEVFEANRSYRQTLRTRYGFKWQDSYGAYSGPWSRELMAYLRGPVGAPRFSPDQYDAEVYENGPANNERVRWLERFEFWRNHDWEQRDDSNKMNVATSITAFLMMIWDNDPVRELLCPPKEAYEPSWAGRPVLAGMEDLIEQGHVAGITIPLDWAAGIGRTIHVLAKLNFQLAVQSRMVPDSETLRPTLLAMDEYPSMATSSERATVGDDVFMARNTRRGRCIVLAAAQTVEQIKPLMGYFRNQIFLSADPVTANYASERCGQHWVRMDSLSLSESNQGIRRSALDTHLRSRDGGTGLSRSWSPHRVPVFDPEVIMGLGLGEAIGCLFDGKKPLPPTRIYLRPSYVPEESSNLTFFEKQARGLI
jgi:hypothetical protein